MPSFEGAIRVAINTLLTIKRTKIELLWIAEVALLQSMEVFVYTLSKVSLIGLGLLVVGLTGFVVMAVALGDHPGLFAVIICWYGLAISCAAFALTREQTQANRGIIALREKR